MDNGRDLKTVIRCIAGYVFTAALLVALTLLSARADGALFKAALPFRPAETATEILFIVFAYNYVSKHSKRADRKKLIRYIPVAVVPLIIALIAFFYLPDRLPSANENIASWLYIVLMPVSEDLVLCALGCTLLMHKAEMKSKGVVIMLFCMAAHEAILSGESAGITVLSVIAALMIGYFEIYLHLSTGSAVFCATFHCLLHICVRAMRVYSSQSVPIIGEFLSVILGIILLSVMLMLGFYMREKLKSAEIYMDEYN